MGLLGRLANIFRNDVARPVQRNVVQPVQRAAQQAPQPRVNAQQLAQALQQHLVQPVEHALPYLQAPPQFSIPGHILAAAAQHIPQAPAGRVGNFVNQQVVKPIKSTDTHVAQILQGHNPYKGSTKQQAGQALQDAINMASVLPAGKGAQVAVKGGAVLPKIAEGAKLGIKAGGAFGAGQGASTALQQNQNLPQALKTIGVNTAVGASAGGALGAAAPAIAGGVEKAAANRVKLNEAGSIKLPEQKPNYSPSPTKATSPQGVKLKNGAAQAERGSGQQPDTHSYLQRQIQQQEAARKAGNPSGLGKVGVAKSDAKTKLIDALAPIEKTLGQRVTEKNAATHITPQLDRVLRADTIGAQYIKDKGLADVIQKVPSTKEFDQYLIAKHAADLEKNGVQTGRNLAADQQLASDLAPRYEPHAQALKQYSEGLLDQAQQYGLISQDLASHLKEKYPNYVPVNRIFGEGEINAPPKGVGGGKASIGQQSIVQKIKGSERNIESPLSSLVDKSIQVVKEGERNKAAQILTGYRDLEGNPFQLRELGKDETVGQKPVISVLENGETRRFETTKEVSDAAKALTKEQLGLIGRILSVPTRVLRLGATGLNPAFALANVAKDTASAFINSSHSLRASPANPKVFVDALIAASNHGSERYGELVRQGAGGTSFDIARNAPVENVRAIRMRKNAASKVLYTVTKPSELFRAAENTIGRSEEFNRAIQYFGNKQAAMSKGVDPEAAAIFGAHAARNNTVNFARAGDYGRVINSVLPYLNAGIQGSRTLLRNLKERPVQTTTKLAITAFFPTAAVTAWNVSDPDRKAAYDDVKQYEKQGNLIIVPPHPVKDKNGKWNVIKLPVSQEIANLSNIVRNGVEAAVGDGSLNVASIIGDVGGTATSFQLESPRQAFGQLIPQGLKPGIEMVTNHNLFTNNQIVPNSQKNLPARDQVGKGTSGTAATVGKLTGLSPRQIDNFIRTATGGLGQNVLNLSDQGLAKVGVTKPNQVHGEGFGESIEGRFKGAQGQSDYDKADTKFADLSKQLQASAGYKALSTDDKAKALNRLQNQVVGAIAPQKNPDGSLKKNLTSKQQDIVNDKQDLNSYLSAQTGSSQYNKKPDAEYQAALKKYTQAKKDGGLTQGQDIKEQNKLARLKAGSGFDKNIRDLYSLNKGQIYDLITTDKNGQGIADQLTKYDQALKDSGSIAKLKFAKGFGSSSGGSSGSGRRVGSAKTAKVAKLKLGKIYTPKKVGLPKSSGKSGSKLAFKKPSAPKKPKAVKIA